MEFKKIIKVTLTAALLTSFVACKNESKPLAPTNGEREFNDNGNASDTESEIQTVARLKTEADEALEKRANLSQEYWDLVNERNELQDSGMSTGSRGAYNAMLAEISGEIKGKDEALALQTELAELKRSKYMDALKDCSTCSQIELQDVEYQVEHNNELDREIEDLDISIDAMSETMSQQTALIEELSKDIEIFEDIISNLEVVNEELVGSDMPRAEEMIANNEVSIQNFRRQLEQKRVSLEEARNTQRQGFLGIDAAASAKQALQERRVQ